MGTKIEARSRAKEFSIRFLRNEGGTVAQLLHPDWVARDDVFLMSDVIKRVESLVSNQARDVKVVVTGGGFFQIPLEREPHYYGWKSEKDLERLVSLVKEKLPPFVEALRSAGRDYVIGVDVLIDGYGIGQFAVLFVGREIKSIVWKSYPVDSEVNYLAGFGTSKGCRSPRFVTTALGQSLILVCHDAQAYNHRNRALVSRAHSPTPRRLVMDEMIQQMEEEKPLWVFNPVHWIEKVQDMKTFSTSYNQISSDHKWRPSVVGAFGYRASVRHDLECLAQKAQYPWTSAGCTILIEHAPI